MAQFCTCPWSLVALLTGVLACGGSEGGTEGATAGTTTGNTEAATSADATAGPTTGADTSTTGESQVAVSHAREFRAAWVATVFNINFPSGQGLPPEALKAELVAILDAVQAAGLNAVVFQVRPECDALYASSLEPWSRFLTGTQGQDPGMDPLQVALDEGHARGLEVHAWLNPFRAAASQDVAFADNHVARTLPQYAYPYDSFVWMDPGAAEVREHLVAVIADLVTRYDVDGIHFDDYFYPYPNGTEFPDDATWTAYQAAGGKLSRADWRRDNVHAMVQAVAAKVAALRPSVRFGISPFGIYRPGIPEGITGFDPYEGLYADPLRWMQEGWVDYLAPQLYWPTTQTPQAYGTLIAWWASVTEGGRYIFAGNYLSKIGTEAVWSVDEFRQQIELSRAHAEAGSQGNIFFQVKPIQDNAYGIADVLRTEFYQRPALTPPIAAMAAVSVEPPAVEVQGGQAMLSHPTPEALRAWVVYAQSGSEFVIDRIVPASQASVDLSPGTWAISAAGKHGVESPGVLVTVP
ncbi:MAG TPA: family 10 glycosylhydrolase [Nannocystis sp.]